MINCEECDHCMRCGIVGALCTAPQLAHPRIIDPDYPEMEKPEVDYTTPDWCPLLTPAI